MSNRLGAAMACHIASINSKGGDTQKFVVIEGVDDDLAEAISKAWDAPGLPLAIASADPDRFGDQALVGASGTGRRNQGAVCLVICTGARLEDRQSLRAFPSVQPGDLLTGPKELATLAQIEPAAPMDGPIRHVRAAIMRAGAAARPSARSVADYFDRCAAGEDPLRALPALGAFADHAAGESADQQRVLANLSLAGRRRGELSPRPADLRRRARRVLQQRPELSEPDRNRIADEVVAALQSGSDELLQLLTYDEALEVLEQKKADLATDVAKELARYRSERAGEQVAWERYETAAGKLNTTDDQRPAAAELLQFDQVEHHEVFEPQTRRRLEQLRKERIISASRPSCPEFALLRCAIALGGIAEIELSAPDDLDRSKDPKLQTRSGASAEIALACARLRLGRLFRDLNEDGVKIDGALLRPANAEWDTVFEDAQLDGAGALTTIQLRIRAREGTAVRLVSWRPDLDDVATLRAAVALAEKPALTLSTSGTPTLEAFCCGPHPEPLPVPAGLEGLARKLQAVAADALKHGLSDEALSNWAGDWLSATTSIEEGGQQGLAEPLALAGAVRCGQIVALTAFSTPKAEWLSQYLDALWSMFWAAHTSKDEPVDEPAEETGLAVAKSTAAHHPAYLRLGNSDDVLLPSGEGRIWSVFGGEAADPSRVAGDALGSVIQRLLDLQPDAAGHLRCIAYGPGAATLLVEQAIALVGKRHGRAVLRKLELFCVGDDRPSFAALAEADSQFAGEPDRPLEIRYLATLDEARQKLGRATPGTPAVHLALLTGLTSGTRSPRTDATEVNPPQIADEVLFAPRTWTRPRTKRRMLLTGPTVTEAGLAWLRLMSAIEDDWPEHGDPIRIPELRTAGAEIRDELLAVHDLALWVATLDRYASRDSLNYAMKDEVAILHQDRRLGGESPLSMVISQKSGSSADRAVGRSLRSAGIIEDLDSAVKIGGALRKVASDGYGVLALEAATTGAGINELVGHVVGFSLLAETTTPWPLPPNCRMLLVSLDDYKHWFPSKRADLLVLALDPAEKGVHVAAIEVKARRSDSDIASRDALDQLKQTLFATRYAAYPDESVHSRLWLNRIADAACAVARESNFKLDADELGVLESLRAGTGTLEWAGLGLVFGPGSTITEKHSAFPVLGDRIPIVVHTMQLTEELLDRASSVTLDGLKTVDAERAPLQGGRTRRRPERTPEPTSDIAPTPPEEAPGSATADQAQPIETAPADPKPEPERHTEPVADADPDETSTSEKRAATIEFRAPLLGWDRQTQEPVYWHAAGPDAQLDNGHTEIWGASGSGKTQFTMSLLGQLAASSGVKFGIADFKNDYSDDFPARTDAQFIDLWNDGAPYNPLALATDNPREVLSAAIELRDIVEVATQTFTRMGIRQREKLKRALEETYALGRQEQRWPTLQTLHDQLDQDLRGIIGDLTGTEIFKDGPPLGDAIHRNVVFGLHGIPGNGLATVLAAGFILSALHMKMQGEPQVANTIKYLAVVDEAHRVAAFKAVGSMLREGRSKGLAVLLATQQPGDLPDEVATNANTRICFRLPDATIAAAAARRLDQNNSGLADQIRLLESGEAFVSLAGKAPRLLNMAQLWRDGEKLGIPSQ